MQAQNLQTGISVDDDGMKITGELPYVKEYTQWSTNPSDQKGNYLALKIDSDGNSTKTKLEGGKGALKAVTDGFCVYRVTDASKQKVVIESTNEAGGKTERKYDLSGLTLGQNLSD